MQQRSVAAGQTEAIKNVHTTNRQSPTINRQYTDRSIGWVLPIAVVLWKHVDILCDCAKHTPITRGPCLNARIQLACKRLWYRIPGLGAKISMLVQHAFGSPGRQIQVN